MARSKEAIRRRAERRNRTVEEQRKIDGRVLDKEQEEWKEQQNARHKRAPSTNDNETTEKDPLKEPGSWICLGCGNHNFASRRFCHSITCNEQQPTDAAASRIVRPSKRQCRHDVATSKPLTWSAQADQSTIHTNKLLRQRFLETNGKGMTAEEVERAKILLARDERKKLKKQKGKTSVVQSDHKKVSTSTLDDKKETIETTPVSPGSEGAAAGSEEARKRNKALRKRYLKTNGKGMTVEEQERAKLLIARDERKRQKRAQQQPPDGGDPKKMKRKEKVAG